MEKRCKNFTSSEKDLLLNVIDQFKHIIENKKTDAVTVQEKNKAWELVAQSYNQQNETGYRSSKQLKELYAFMKRKARKNLFNDRGEQFKTGGGCFIPASDELDYKIINNLKDQFLPDENIYDSSCQLYKDVTNTIEVESGTNITYEVNKEHGYAADSVLEIVSTPTSCTDSVVASTSCQSTNSIARECATKHPFPEENTSNATKRGQKRKDIQTVAQAIIDRKNIKTVNEKEILFKKNKLLDIDIKIKEQELQLILKKNKITDLDLHIKTLECEVIEAELKQKLKDLQA